MSDKGRLTWKSGRLLRTPITDFLGISETVKNPSIPNLPLTTPSAGGNTYNESISESATASDAWSNVGVLGNSFTESSAAEDAFSAVGVFTTSFSETSSATDGFTNVAIVSNALTESGLAGDSWIGGLSINDVIEESSVAADSWAEIVTGGGDTHDGKGRINWQVKRRKLTLEEKPEQHLNWMIQDGINEYFAKKNPKATVSDSADLAPIIAKIEKAPIPLIEYQPVEIEFNYKEAIEKVLAAQAALDDLRKANLQAVNDFNNEFLLLSVANAYL